MKKILLFFVTIILFFLLCYFFILYNFKDSPIFNYPEITIPKMNKDYRFSNFVIYKKLNTKVICKSKCEIIEKKNVIFKENDFVTLYYYGDGKKKAYLYYIEYTCYPKNDKQLKKMVRQIREHLSKKIRQNMVKRKLNTRESLSYKDSNIVINFNYPKKIVKKKDYIELRIYDFKIMDL